MQSIYAYHIVSWVLAFPHDEDILKITTWGYIYLHRNHSTHYMRLVIIALKQECHFNEDFNQKRQGKFSKWKLSVQPVTKISSKLQHSRLNISWGVRTASQLRRGIAPQHGAHLGPVSPRWAPCWPHEPCYQGHLQRVPMLTWHVLLSSLQRNKLDLRACRWTPPLSCLI